MEEPRRSARLLWRPAPPKNASFIRSGMLMIAFARHAVGVDPAPLPEQGTTMSAPIHFSTMFGAPCVRDPDTLWAGLFPATRLDR
jgi:hypothetical protein